MKRYIIGIIMAAYIVATLLVGFFLTNKDHLVFSEDFSSYNKKDNYNYLVEQAKDYSVIYCGDEDGKIMRFNDLSMTYGQQKIVDVSVTDAVFALTKLTMGYRIIKFDPSLEIVKVSEIFKLNQDHDFLRFSVMNGHGYITGIERGNLSAVVYDFPLDRLHTPEEGELVPKQPTGEEEDPGYMELKSFYRLESTDGLIDNAYYNGITIDFNSLEYESMLGQAQEYSQKMNLSYPQSLRINRSVMVIVLVILFAGVVVILLINNLMKKRVRYINQLMVWEIFIISGTLVMIGISGKLLVPIIWGAVLSAISTTLILLENRDVKILCKNMTLIASGIFDIEKPRGNSNEVQVLWRGMNELKYQFEKYKYLQDGSTVAAMKFLPNKLEDAFFKNSLDELKPGDRTSVFGTMMYVKTKERATDSLIRDLEDYELSTGGRMIMGNSQATDVRLLFPEELEDVVQRGMRIEDFLLDKKMTIVYFDDRFEFAIAGTPTKSVLSVNSSLTPLMEAMTKWFYDRGIRMVITGSVKKRDNIIAPMRKIGYVEIDGEKHELFEVLDVYTEGIRSIRLKTLKDFDEALSLFYKQNFYLARTAFSDILKVDELDEMSRWYLFMCEQYLNDPDAQKTYALNPQG